MALQIALSSKWDQGPIAGSDLEILFFKGARLQYTCTHLATITMYSLIEIRHNISQYMYSVMGNVLS